jgi:hypothetical protein
MSSATIKSLFDKVNGKQDLSTHFAPDLGKQMSQAASEWRKEFPDLKWKLGRVVEQRDRVSFQYVAEGTHKPTGKKASWSGSGVAIVKGGKVVTLQVVEDFHSRIADLGQVFVIPQDNISGTWKGELFGIDFTLQADQNPPADAVTGTISGLGLSLPVTGENDPPNVKLSGDSPKGKVTLTGTWTGANSISGTLNGAGFQNQPVELDR